MPIRHVDVFDDFTANLNLEINPYVRALKEATEFSLPLPARHGPFLRGLQGRWKNYFSTRDSIGTSPSFHAVSPPLILEIGVHKGRCLTAMAQAHPEMAFIGLDITFKRVVTTARKCLEAKLNNTLSILADARQLPKLFMPGELTGVVAFFPDPWTKKESQIHNQLFNAEFCKVLASLLEDGGFFWLKTDSSRYFNSISTHMESLGFIRQVLPSGICAETYESCFEAAFRAKNVTTYEGSWKQPQRGTLN